MKRRSQCNNPSSEHQTTRTWPPVRTVQDAATQTEPYTKPSAVFQFPGPRSGSARTSPYTVPPRKEAETSARPACCSCEHLQLVYQPLPVYMMAAPVQMPLFGLCLPGPTAMVTPGHSFEPMVMTGSGPAPRVNY